MSNIFVMKLTQEIFNEYYDVFDQKYIILKTSW